MFDKGPSFHARLLCGAAVVSMVAAAGSAAAQDRSRINIEPQPLVSALNAFGVQTGQPVISTPELTSTKTSPGVRDADDPAMALTQLLAGTGLSYRCSGDTYLIVPGPQAGPAPARCIVQAGAGASDGATGTVEALIVTAQKREEDIQDVPIAISAFTQEDLTRSQVAGGPDLMTQVPNMTFTKTNFSSYSIQVRGIGTQAISATTDPAVAVAFNNTPFVRNHFFEQEFYDLQRVEVLRGPQGTLYGRNATAGVVNVISAKPSFRFEAKVSGDIANYKSSRIEGMVNIPLVEDKVALRIAGAWTKRDGFVKNILTGEQTDGRDLWSGRVSLAVEPTDWLRADLIYEHFEEDDSRLRSGKQMCTRDPGPATVGSKEVGQGDYALAVGVNYLSQGCLPSSLYSPDAFQTPNGFALTYYGALAALGSPVALNDPYASTLQSRNLREIETHIEPDYEASADVVELQVRVDLSDSLTLASETGFSRDYIFSWQDFNRFNTKPGAFGPVGIEFPVVHADGTFCDPQVGCTNRLAAADLATARSQQFSQEFRLSSDFEGPFNFNLGANFLRYDTEDKYYVFINSLTVWMATLPWFPGVTDNSLYFETDQNSSDWRGYVWSDPDQVHGLGTSYIDPNDVHNLNDQGRNYFLSKNPYHLLSYAVFGEAYYEFSPDLKVTAGLRWTIDKKTAPVMPSWLLAGGTYGTATRKVIEQEWQEPTGRLAVDWKPDLGFTDETLLYASYVRGYKAGGANPPPPVTVWGPVGINEEILDDIVQHSVTHPESFEPEFVNAYEVGSKNTLLDGRLTLNLGAFYYDYTGYQISQIVNRSAVNLNFDAKVWGAELEADWRPVENLRLGLKVGYENTRMADGSKAVDLMDRTAGNPDWVLFKPFPPQASNCIIPLWLAEMATSSFNTDMCSGYIAGVDPFTDLPYVENPVLRRSDGVNQPVPIADEPVSGGVSLIGYPGFNPASAPNNGEGFYKDLSGNELPNAPDYTVTITADYTLPLPSDWLMTLHTDLYYQSEAWTRVFNTEGYDKLKAYTNVNVAAIFTNEDAGWNVMAYVKNVMDRDSITGAFLNSDDTGLSTNVFLTEPRLYGLRVTKMWTGGGVWGGFGDGADVYQPWHVGFEGLYGEFDGAHDLLTPDGVALSDPEQPYPLGVQNDLDWGSMGGVSVTYKPNPHGWFAKAGVRYGRASGDAEAHPKWNVEGGYSFGPATFQFVADVTGQPVELWEERLGGKYFDPAANGIYEYAVTTSTNEESFAVADFIVGRDVGLGSLGDSTLGVGLRYAKLKSGNEVLMHGRPHVEFPETDIAKYGWELDRFHAKSRMSREFEGVGPAVEWDASFPLLGDRKTSGGVNLDASLGAAALFGKQTVDISGEIHGDDSLKARAASRGGPVTVAYTTPLDIERSESVTVPAVSASLGLGYAIGGFKVSGGYRIERYLDAIDGGVGERREYDRQYDGPYFKVSIGFGG